MFSDGHSIRLYLPPLLPRFLCLSLYISRNSSFEFVLLVSKFCLYEQQKKWNEDPSLPRFVLTLTF